MPIITVPKKPIIREITPSTSGLDRRVIFGNFTWNETEEYLNITFKCEQGIKTIDEETDAEIWQIFDNPDGGIMSYPQPFTADNSTIVDASTGLIVKKPNSEPTEDLDNPNKIFMGQYDYFYSITRGEEVLIVDLITGFIEHANATDDWRNS